MESKAQQDKAALKTAEEEMQAAVQRAIEAFNGGAEPAQRGLEVIDKVMAWQARVQAMTAQMDPSLQTKYAMDMSVYSQLTTAATDMQAAFVKADAARLEGEQCVQRLAAMMQPELSQQERDRLDQSVTGAMDTLAELKRLTGERQKAVGVVQATLGSFERVNSDEFFGRAP